MKRKNLKVGNKVKCIDDSPHGLIYESDDYNCSKDLILNKIYTITKILFNSYLLKEEKTQKYWDKTKFIKVDCLKIKVRKLKRLIK